MPELLSQVASSAAGFPTVPVGTILALDPRWSNVTAPATGTISQDGYAVCDGQVPPSGHQLGTGPASLPNLTDGRFLRGGTTASAGGSGGSETFSLLIGNMPSHSHGNGTLATSIGLSGSAPSLTGTTTFAGAGHVHGSTGLVANIWPQPGSTALFFQRRNNGNTTLQFMGERRDFVNNGSGQSTSQQETALTAISGFTDGNSFNRSVGITGGSYSLSGNNKVGGITSTAGSGAPLSHIPKYLDVVYVMKVRS